MVGARLRFFSSSADEDSLLRLYAEIAAADSGTHGSWNLKFAVSSMDLRTPLTLLFPFDSPSSESITFFITASACEVVSLNSLPRRARMYSVMNAFPSLMRKSPSVARTSFDQTRNNSSVLACSWPSRDSSEGRRSPLRAFFRDR